MFHVVQYSTKNKISMSMSMSMIDIQKANGSIL